MRILSEFAVIYSALIFFVVGGTLLHPTSSNAQEAVDSNKETLKAMDEIVDPGNKVAEEEDDEGVEGVEDEGAATTDGKPADEAVTSDVPDPQETKTEEVKSEPSPPPMTVSTVEAEATPEEVDAPRKGIYGGRFYGREKIQLAANKSTFGAKQKCYKDIYGGKESNVSMGVDWFPKDWAVNPGVMFKMGSISARGKAMVSSSGAPASEPCSALVPDENSHTTLQFIPIQLGLKIQMSPFNRKYLVFDFWVAGEYGWWQETRDAPTAMIVPMNVRSTSLSAATKVFTNSGSKLGSSVGASVHLLMNPLDERGVHSMVDTLGIGYVYLTVFGESVSSVSVRSVSSGLSFARNSAGVGFTFETAK